MKPALTLALAFFVLSGIVSAQTLSDYQTTVTNQGPTAYYKLDGTLVDAMGGPALTANGAGGSFMPDAFRNATNSYGFFNSDDALIQATDILSGGDAGTNAAAAGKGSITLLFRALDGVTTG